MVAALIMVLPAEALSKTRVPQIALGESHTLAIKSDGTLWAWGRNYEGQLGGGTTKQRNTPIQIGSDSTWVSIAAGGNHSTGLKSTDLFY
jgi:alpha-tubulin suppressor-like RCC1 family protein